jgi:hypothetical protein
VSLIRKALKPFVFSDGTCIPAGSRLLCAAGPIQNDNDYYADPTVFNGFRFVVDGSVSGPLRKTLASTGASYLPFGYGKHAWCVQSLLLDPKRRPLLINTNQSPGRFFAASQLKLILAHVLLTYDVKHEVEGIRPPNHWIVRTRLPNLSAKLMFRRRAALAEAS